MYYHNILERSHNEDRSNNFVHRAELAYSFFFSKQGAGQISKNDFTCDMSKNNAYTVYSGNSKYSYNEVTQ